MKISIAMCTFNGQAFLHEQLESLANQQRLPDELIIYDDGSADQTAQIVEFWREKFSFTTIFHRHAQRLGCSQNFASAFARCTGDIIMPCDQDDVWLPKKISRLASLFESHSKLMVAAADSQLVDAQLQPLGHTKLQAQRFCRRDRRQIDRGNAFNVFLRICYTPGHSMAFRRSLLGLALPIPGLWEFDWWLAILAAALGDVVLLDEPLALYRSHAHQATGIGRKSLPQWYSQAPTLPEQMHARQAEKFQSLTDRLTRGGDRVGRASHRLALANERVAFLKARSAMRKPGQNRLPLIARQLLRGRYHRVGRGWLTAARDLVG